MSRQEVIQRLIEVTGVSIVKTGGFVACYDPSSNTIELPQNRVVAAIRSAFRPTYPHFSLAHELGHAVLAVFDFDKERAFEKLFGDTSEWYDDKAYIKSAFALRPEGFVTEYASFHPEEDFADTFAFVLTAPRDYWEDADELVIKKKKYIEGLLKRMGLRGG